MWFSKSISDLKDQITTLTNEVLNADENEERPQFIPAEKFNRLLTICEEKEDQICQLQLELDAFRNQHRNPNTIVNERAVSDVDWKKDLKCSDQPLEQNKVVKLLSGDETMSNNSEKSEDLSFQDFEILKSKEINVTSQTSRSTSTKSEYEFSVCNTETQTNQTDYDVSVIDSETQTYQMERDIQGFNAETQTNLIENDVPVFDDGTQTDSPENYFTVSNSETQTNSIEMNSIGIATDQDCDDTYPITSKFSIITEPNYHLESASDVIMNLSNVGDSGDNAESDKIIHLEKELINLKKKDEDLKRNIELCSDSLQSCDDLEGRITLIWNIFRRIKSQLGLENMNDGQLMLTENYLVSKYIELLNKLEQNRNAVSHLETKLEQAEKSVNSLTNERDCAVTVLKAKHDENMYYHSEIQKINALYVEESEKNKNFSIQIEELQKTLNEKQNLANEVQRLQEYLLVVEESSTAELLKADQQVNELKKKLNECEQEIITLTTTQQSTNAQSNQMSQTYQKEVLRLSQEKDQLAAKLQDSRNELKKAQNDVQNLQLALDLFHKNNKSEIIQATEKLHGNISKLESENQRLKEIITKNQETLKTIPAKKDHTKEECEKHERIITQLDVEINALKSTVSKLHAKISDFEKKSGNELHVNLLKNVFLQYLSSNTESMKSQALHILSEVLELSSEEKNRIRLPYQKEKNLSPQSSQKHSQSLINEFITFVEKESTPSRQMNRRVSSDEKNNPITSLGSTLENVMLPTLLPQPVGHNSGYILKDVLQ